ncbi:MAG: hypothetical protein H6Q72_2536 [Firmicutes bacterium]|nr:hypothetical protein [Bacillota bacterium]
MDNIDLPIWFVIYWVWNFIAFLLMRTDKQYARNQARRIREKTFFRMALFGGAAGVLIGMYVYRHKTLHSSFVIGIPVILLGNLVCMYLLL